MHMMCVFLSVGARYVWVGLKARPQRKALEFHTGGYEPPIVGTENETRVFCQSSRGLRS